MPSACSHSVLAAALLGPPFYRMAEAVRGEAAGWGHACVPDPVPECPEGPHRTPVIKDAACFEAAVERSMGACWGLEV